MWLWLVLAAALGAAASSFLRVVLDRAAAAPGSSLSTRSRCPRCGVSLRAPDVLPVLGFVLLRGRRACTAAIALRHPLGELAGAALWGVTAVLVGLTRWLPVRLAAPAAAVLLTTRALRQRGAHEVLLALLPIAGVLLVLGLGGALAGRWSLYVASGVVGVVALLAA